MNAIVSIHDLTPQTFAQVERILEWLQVRAVPPVTLLVVPGRPWQSAQLQRLRQLTEAGHELAAHGWQHQTQPRRLAHRIHAALISRNVAEHLDLDSPDILALMQRARDWFPAHGLPSPDCYVPPAWALGRIARVHLAQAPFRTIETTRGLIHLHAHTAASVQPAGAPPGSGTRACTCQNLPLTGYQADTRLRECFLRRWNALQARIAVRTRRPLRISIHPDDLQLRIADQLDQHLRSVQSFLPYSGLNRT